jgi:hypothetical protein
MVNPSFGMLPLLSLLDLTGLKRKDPCLSLTLLGMLLVLPMMGYIGSMEVISIPLITSILMILPFDKTHLFSNIWKKQIKLAACTLLSAIKENL